jgi:hypothetical protein
MTARPWTADLLALEQILYTAGVSPVAAEALNRHGRACLVRGVPVHVISGYLRGVLRRHASPTGRDCHRPVHCCLRCTSGPTGAVRCHRRRAVHREAGSLPGDHCPHLDSLMGVSNAESVTYLYLIVEEL